MTAFDRSWNFLKSANYDFDFIEGVPWQKRVDHIAQKLADHYHHGNTNTNEKQAEYNFQRGNLLEEMEGRMDARYSTDNRLIYPTEKDLHDQIGPSFYGTYNAANDHILFNLPKMFDEVNWDLKHDRIRRLGGRAKAMKSPYLDQELDRKLIERIIRNINHEVGHAATRDEIDRFNEEVIDWDSWDYSQPESKDSPLSRHQHASEALAYIMEKPHDQNWRERFNRHDAIYRWLNSEGDE